VLVGDCSGNSWEKACGRVFWQTRGRSTYYGAIDKGSINLAETMPYLSLLSWYDKHYGKTRLDSSTVLRIHIITNSQVVAIWDTSAMQPSAPIPRIQGVFRSSM